jgi:hypothetical protein
MAISAKPTSRSEQLQVCPSSGQNGTGTRPMGKHPEEKQRYNSCGSPGRRTIPHG